MAERKTRARRSGAKTGSQASTGAWWKSTEPEEEMPASEAGQKSSDQTGPGQGGQEEAGKTPRRPAGRRKKKAAAADSDSGASVAAGGEPAQAVPPAPLSAEAPETVGDSGAGLEAESAEVADVAAEPPPPEPKEAAVRASRKPRHGHRRGKKTETPAPESGAGGAVPDTVLVAEAPAPEVPASEEASSEPSAVSHDPEAVYKLLVNAEEPEECRVALLENGRLESFHVSNVEREATRNNIYKGRIVSIEANLQVAFVDIGTGRNAFLPFSEIHPEYYRENLSDRVRELVNQQQWKKLKIEEVMQKGQEVLVQVVKEVTGNKGASVTTYLSLPGRCLVLLPGSDSAGISRKITGEERRGALREMMGELELPEGIGYIVRTASVDINQSNLKEDLDRLLSLWEQIRGRGQTVESPALIYQEQDTVVRFLRDHFFPEIQEIVVDTEATLQQVRDFIQQLPAEQRRVRVRQHRGVKPIFNQHNIEEQIESIYRPQVPLPSGGSIVIDPTEALVAIDVNSGRTSKNSDFEDSIFQANMEAAEELARQLRLRDLGGLIVVDFIDMRNRKHIQEVERQVKASMKRDKAKVDVSRISRFGLMQISRQKMGAPTAKGSYIVCPHCQGRGVVRSVETLALFYLRRIQTGIIRKKVARVECRFPLEVAQYLLNRKKEELVALERQHNAAIDIIVRPDMRPMENEMEFLGAKNVV